MDNLSSRFKAFVDSGSVPDGVLDALGKFVDSEPRRTIVLAPAHTHEELEERMLLGRTLMKALVDQQPTMADVVTSALWSLVVVAPMDQLRSFVSAINHPGILLSTRMIRSRLEILLKTFLAKEREASYPPPYPSRDAAESIKCLQRDGECCVITGSATPHVCHIVPFSVTKRKETTMDAVCAIFNTFWGQARNSRLQALFADDGQINSARNAICLSPLLHDWWGRAYLAFEPLEKLHNGTRVRLRWLHRTGFSVWDEVALDTNSTDHLHPPSLEGVLGAVDLRSGHPVLDGSVYDLTSDDQATEVSYDLLQLQWDLLRMAALCGAAEAADDPSWNPEDEDPVYAAEKWLRELELEGRGG